MKRVDICREEDDEKDPTPPAPIAPPAGEETLETPKEDGKKE